MSDLLTQMQDAGRLQIITVPAPSDPQPTQVEPTPPPTRLRFATHKAQIVEFPHSAFHGEKRVIEARWPLDGQQHGEPGRYVALTAQHSGGSKRFIASVNVEKRDEDRWTTLPFNAAQLDSQPCSRYSKKALLGYFRSLLATDELAAAIDKTLAANAAE